MIGPRCYCIQVVFTLVLCCWNLPEAIHGQDVVGGAHGRILANSKSPQAADLLRGVVRGERYFAITITEPN
jgi:hypothetical protein